MVAGALRKGNVGSSPPLSEKSNWSLVADSILGVSAD